MQATSIGDDANLPAQAAKVFSIQQAEEAVDQQEQGDGAGENSGNDKGKKKKAIPRLLRQLMYSCL